MYGRTKGFASEINLYIRAAFIANKLGKGGTSSLVLNFVRPVDAVTVLSGYTLLADDEAWQYGSLTYVFPRHSERE